MEDTRVSLESFGCLSELTLDKPNLIHLKSHLYVIKHNFLTGISFCRYGDFSLILKSSSHLSWIGNCLINLSILDTWFCAQLRLHCSLPTNTHWTIKDISCFYLLLPLLFSTFLWTRRLMFYYNLALKSTMLGTQCILKTCLF